MVSLRARRGLGCMRLSTDRGRDDERAVAVLHAALDAGVTLLDTADAYCWNQDDLGHNERLIAGALASWTGDRASVIVATKGGLTRPRGLWVADGRARHLRAACEASLRALGVERLPLYQLHAPDPRTPLATSVRALASLRDEGLIEAIGLCNVNVTQLQEARAIVEVAAVQVELSLWHDDAIRNGLVPYCLDHGIAVLAHRPLGGPSRRARLLREPILAEIAERHGATPFEIALSALTDRSDLIVPLPGATRIQTARSAARRPVALTEEDREQIHKRFQTLSRRAELPGDVQPRPGSIADADVVVVMGMPGAGKSAAAAPLVSQGYLRLNRDEAGGTLADLLPMLDQALASGTPRVVLDNTYATRQSRAAVIDIARRHNVPVRCVWMATSLEDAQTNAATRIVRRHGKQLAERELKAFRKSDPGAFGPSAQFRYQRELEPPDISEGFARVDVVPFARERDASYDARGLLIWCDGILLGSRSDQRVPLTPDDVVVPEGRVEVLRRFQGDGYRLLGLGWRPEIADGKTTAADVEATFARFRETSGLDIDIEYCPHAAGPPTCWCRKPLPGLGVVFIERYALDPSRSIYVGAGAQDPGLARRLGIAYRDAATLFGAVTAS